VKGRFLGPLLVDIRLQLQRTKLPIQFPRREYLKRFDSKAPKYWSPNDFEWHIASHLDVVLLLRRWGSGNRSFRCHET